MNEENIPEAPELSCIAEIGHTRELKLMSEQRFVWIGASVLAMGSFLRCCLALRHIPSRIWRCRRCQLPQGVQPAVPGFRAGSSTLVPLWSSHFEDFPRKSLTLDRR